MMKLFAPAFLVVLLPVASAVSAREFVYPDNPGVIDVTRAPYNAVPDDSTDDTDAIQAALDDYPNGNRIIYLPNGTYRISTTLRWGLSTEESCGTCQKRTCLQGQNRDSTVLRLIDNAPGFGDPSNRKAVLWTGRKPAQRFRNAVWSLTVNTGRGNPGACGIQYNTSNQGSMRHVRIVSEDGQGVAGLDVSFTDEIGPGLVYDCTIEGYDYGVLAYVLNSLTFQDLTLKGQNIYGIKNARHVMSVRGLHSTNTVPAVYNDRGVMALLNVRCVNPAGTSDSAAIINDGRLYARNIHAEGYVRTIDNRRGSEESISGSAVAEFTSHAPGALFEPPVPRAHLEEKKPPPIPWDSVDEWVSPMDFGAKGDGKADDTEALQKAIDAGRRVVYLPAPHKFKFTEITLRGNVRRFIALGGKLSRGTIRFVDGEAPAVAFERINSLYTPTKLVHQSSRTLCVRSCTAVEITGNGSGGLFIEDCVAPRLEFHNKDQRIYAWQLNTEGRDATNVVNDGARLWILGFKTEQAQTKIETRNDGFTDLFGAHIYAQGAEKTTPLFVIDNAAASFAAVRQLTFNGRYYNDFIRETRGDTTMTLTRKSAGNTLSLFTGYRSGSVANRLRGLPALSAPAPLRYRAALLTSPARMREASRHGSVRFNPAGQKLPMAVRHNACQVHIVSPQSISQR